MESKNPVQAEAKLSSRHAAVWDRLQSAHHRKEAVEGTIFRCIRRGYLVDFDGVIGFLPGSLLDVLPVVDITPFLKRQSYFMVLKCDPVQARLIVSRRATLSPLDVDTTKLSERFQVGQLLDVTVCSNLPYATFVDLGNGIIGYLPRPEGEVEPAVGGKLCVEVVRVQEDTQRIIVRASIKLQAPRCVND